MESESWVKTGQMDKPVSGRPERHELPTATQLLVGTSQEFSQDAFPITRESHFPGAEITGARPCQLGFWILAAAPCLGVHM